jgi:hypothetical protein
VVGLVGFISLIALTWRNEALIAIEKLYTHTGILYMCSPTSLGYRVEVWWLAEVSAQLRMSWVEVWS